MSIKILQLCLVIVSNFKEFVKFCLALARFVKTAVTNKILVKTNIVTINFAPITTKITSHHDLRSC